MNKWLKLILIVVFTVGILVLSWVLFRQIMTPLEYQKELKIREAAVIERITEIRSAEQAFKQKNQRYTGDWDSLINFVLNDSLEFERKLYDEDDSIGMAMLKRSGRQNIQKFSMPARDTIFSPKRLTTQQIENMKFIPYAQEGTQFILNAAMLTTESKVVVPVFEAKAPYKAFMYDLDQQELINLIDNAKNVFYKYPGIQVGDVTKTTNDAGNWE
ncbi:MAG: hypothetical protein LBR57_00380 [Alistipes sp.]|jgi:hypothetical protein|nr:hypothetical protein [Alistipes sp.]